MHFLVKWKGYPTSDNSWEKAEDVHAEDLIVDFRKWRLKGRRTYIKSGRVDKESPPPTSFYHSLLPSHMSSHSEPSVMGMPSVASPYSLLVVSAPENTPTSHPLTPQLAIHTEPILDNGNDSMVNYVKMTHLRPDVGP